MNVSHFRNYTDKQPMTTTLDTVVSAIRGEGEEGEKLAALTDTYRRTNSKAIKAESPLFAVACLFDGGKAHGNITALTGLSLVDIDHVVSDELLVFSGQCSGISDNLTNNSSLNTEHSSLATLRQKAISDPHTLLCYTTISGSGLRIIYRYELDTTFDIDSQKNFYTKAFLAGNAHYAALLGVATDLQCKNVTRLSGLAHDPQAYYNPDAVPFAAQWIVDHGRQESLRRKERWRHDRELARLQSCYDKTIRREVEADGAVYASGSHNDYVMRVGYKLNQFGFSRDAAVEWARRAFPDYADTEQVILSCYNRTEEFATKSPKRSKRLSHSLQANSPNASVDDIKTFLGEHISLRYNEVTGRVECSVFSDECSVVSDNLSNNSSLNTNNYLPITDRIVNSLWSEMSRTARVNVNDIFRVIDSDYVPSFNPFRDYLNSLPPWSEDDGDHIAALADTITVRGGEEKQRLFRRYLKKWLVAMVAAWIDESVVNNVILVLIGEQGSYKTTWFNHLLPPVLRRYFYTKTNANRMGRDDLLTLAQYALVCCEELDTMRPAELNQLKAAVTMPSIDERAAYARFHEHRRHIASFCGTGNNAQFLSDPTGNRRWLPFEVQEIRSPRDEPFRHDLFFSQAVSLLRSGFRFWFSKEEIQELSSHNRQFETPRLEQELVMLYFRKPGENEHGQFMPTARIMQHIGTNITQKLSAVWVGRALVEMGFQKVMVRHVRGFIVVPRTGDEIMQYQKSLALPHNHSYEEEQ